MQKIKQFTFHISSGKLFNESFKLSTTIKKVLKEISLKRKYVDDHSFIIYMGRLLDLESTLYSIFNDDDDMQLLFIENERPEQIELKLCFNFDKRDKIEYKIKFVKYTEVLNIHYFVSQLSGQELDSIRLIKKDEELKDDDLLESDETIKVEFDPSIEITKSFIDKLNENMNKVCNKPIRLEGITCNEK